MGVNARNADRPTAIMERLTRSREDRDAELRARVRSGELTVEEYLVSFKGYRPEHAADLAPQFRKAIFG